MHSLLLYTETVWELALIWKIIVVGMLVSEDANIITVEPSLLNIILS